MDLETKFIENVIDGFNANFNEIGPKIYQMLLDNRERNQQDDTGKQQTVMTVKPAIRVELDNSDNMRIAICITGKSVEEISCTIEREISPNNQGEFDFNSSNEEPMTVQEPPTEAELIGALQAVDEEITTGDVQSYFANSVAYKNYQGWLSAGNADYARNIIINESCAETFIDLLKSVS